ncbi:MAG: DNA recombination protein RmuC [Candidatus Yanofskybacteria bacterium CG10_big_fil_rev_8_21_14_0_10_46_23]|uniref:DNA recombination protein RmuC n=1 Tax=Candidatus Yanofskybacteria bacterium CG10_big_fil_rev_8_21_14_0_10_46_23 TaxID=1975098 RepID=A0A2H0R6A3_9BACT|nr:MAG: DNA recombination protein RmuC [Candidatus Yanofskybacteria bacterium CG10_big_fil_rev_8_21_14_0_10_46_23]
MDLILVLNLVILIVVAFLAYAILKRSGGSDHKSNLLLQNQMNEINRTVQEQYGKSTEIVREITKELTKVGQGQREVVDIAKQLEGLQNILKNPKQRGMYGEYSLEVLLKNGLNPKSYAMQYKFENGDLVDAAIFIGDKIIPVDSKFSLENYNRIVQEKDSKRREELENAFRQDLKIRIDETAKYIRPEEGTVNYAFMFIPAEGIYYDLLNNEVGAIKSSSRDLIEYAVNDKKVHIVSPTTLYAVLQSLLQSARDYQIQESTKDILKNVSMLSKHLGAYQEYHDKLGNQLGTVINTYNRTYKELSKIDKDVTKLTGESIDVEVKVLDKPQMEE